MELSHDQEIIVKDVSSIISMYSRGRGKQVVGIGGYAGTGKTQIIPDLIKLIKYHSDTKFFSAAIATYTGKAASVIKDRFNMNLNIDVGYIGTIHGLIYKPKFEYDSVKKKSVIVGWDKHLNIPYDVIIIDEASMVGYKTWNDLLSYGIPIVAIGDHGQLPPVENDNFKTFNLMSNPDFKLEKIHRQALNNPIISLSSYVRKHGHIPYGISDDKKVFKLHWDEELCQRTYNKVNVFDDTITILCGFNSTRIGVNKAIRKRLNYKKEIPYPGERVICLQNNHSSGIMNGQTGTIMWLTVIDKFLYRTTIEMDGDYTYSTAINRQVFNDKDSSNTDRFSGFNHIVKRKLRNEGIDNYDFFDYAYAITVHKSQGSEWNRIILFEEKHPRWDSEYYMRWLYTGITRAKEKLFVIGFD